MQICVSKEMQGNAHEMEQKLQSLASYPDWFPKKFNAKGILVNGNETLMFSPLPGVKVGWEKVETQDSQVKLKYKTGPVKGHLWWNVKPQQKNLLVENVVDITGYNLLTRLLIHNPIFRWKHKRDMHSLLNHLAKS